MNIAILIQTLGGGGAERVAQIIGDYYVEQGHNVYYFLGDTDIKQVYPVKGQIVNTGIKSCGSNNFFGDAQVLLKLLAASFQMRKYKCHYKIDAAISFIEELNYINILSKGREKVITRICTVLSAHGGRNSILYNKNVIRFFYNMADNVVVLCREMRNDMHQNYKVAMSKMVQIPNPVLVVSHNSSDVNWKYGDKVIIAVGRLEQKKQYERIIRAFTYVARNEPDAKLLILGKGSLEKSLKELCRKYGVKDRVIFAGFKKNPEDYLKKSKVFVMASEVEGMPNSMLEAMINGLPVVTTDTPGACAEILGKKDGVGNCKEIEYCTYGVLTPYISGMVQDGSNLEKKEILLGQAMLELLQNDEMRMKYSQRSQKRASMYNLANIMSKWNRLLGI